ncbi:hypothetical protein LJB71_04740 [Thermomonas sp. S9]|nr:hypothetical protein [Thermomonas sp. S9]
MSGERRQPARVGIALAGNVTVLLPQLGFQQVAVAARIVIQRGIGLQRAHLVVSLRLLAHRMAHTDRAQPCQYLRAAAGHAGIPGQRLVVALQQLGHLPQQQAAHRIRLGGAGLELGVQRGQPVLVAQAVQQVGAARIGGIVLRAGRQHLRGARGVAQGLVFAGQAAAQGGRSPGRRRHRVQHRARLLQITGLARPLRAQQGHPRLAGEALHHLGDDAIDQLRLLQPLCQPAERQPGLQLRGQLAAIDDLAHHRHHQRRLPPDRPGQGRQRGLPAVVRGQ